MRELIGNLFSYTEKDKRILRCVTTNGIVKRDGKLVMGAGVALQARNLYPEIQNRLGQLVKAAGNQVYILADLGIASFPTKDDYRQDSSLTLIEKSCKELTSLSAQWDLVLLSRPGCGNGNLDWKQVKPLLQKYFTDDKFVILVQ